MDRGQVPLRLCALFVNLLTPCAVFSKCMQNNEIDILGTHTCLLKTLKETDKLASKPLAQWTTYAATVEKCKEEDGHTFYQCQQLQEYSEAQTYYTSKYEEYCCSVSHWIKSRLSCLWPAGSERQIFSTDFTWLGEACGGRKWYGSNWQVGQKICRSTWSCPSKHRLIYIKTEFLWHDCILSAVHLTPSLLLIITLVWWRLFHAPNSAKWANVLILAELLFSLPASNGKLERVFSLLGTTKVDKCSHLTNESLDDLLLLKSGSTPYASFSADASIDLRWSANSRRPSQKGRKEYRPRSIPSTSQVYTRWLRWKKWSWRLAGILGWDRTYWQWWFRLTICFSDSHTQCEGRRPLDAHWARMPLQKKNQADTTGNWTTDLSLSGRVCYRYTTVTADFSSGVEDSSGCRASQKQTANCRGCPH